MYLLGLRLEIWFDLNIYETVALSNIRIRIRRKNLFLTFLQENETFPKGF